MTLVTLISTLFIIAGRFFVKIFITVFGWAMVIFFGRIPEEKSRLFSLLAVLSLIWVLLIIGLTYPALVKPFYDYIPYHNIKKMVYFILETVGVLIIPVIVGELAVFIKGRKEADWKSYLQAVLIGYLYSFLMGIAMILMLLFAPFITAKRYIKREKALHLPVVIVSGHTAEVVGRLLLCLNMQGFSVKIKRSPMIYRLPVLFVRKIMKRLLEVEGRQNEMLYDKEFRIFINPTDIMIEGNKQVVDRVLADIVMELIFDEAHLTYSEQGQEIESRGLSVYREAEEGVIKEQEGIEKIVALREKAKLCIQEYEEWERICLALFVYENRLQKKLLMKSEKGIDNLQQNSIIEKHH